MAREHEDDRRTFLGLASWWVVVILVAALLAALATGVYIARKPLAAFLVQSYLERRGVRSEVVFDRLERGGFSARVRIGPDEPEFTAEIFDVTLDYRGLLTLPRIGSVRLIRPVLRASYDGRTFHVGSLQPLLDEALAREPEGPGPSFSIEDGTLMLSTPKGEMRFEADAIVDGGRLDRMRASLSPTVLGDENFRAEIATASVSAGVAGDAVHGTVALKLDSFALKGDTPVEADDLRATVAFRGLEWRRSEQVLNVLIATAEATIRAANLESREMTAEEVKASIALANVQGSVTSDTLEATARMEGRMTSSDVGTAHDFASSLSLIIASDRADLAITEDGWSIAGPARVDVAVTALKHPLKSGEIAFPTVKGTFAGSGRLAEDGVTGTFKGAMSARAAVPQPVVLEMTRGLPFIADEPAIRTALSRALGDLAIPEFALTISRSGTETTIASAPVSMVSASGARMTIAPRANEPLVRLDASGASGSLSARIAGGGLPSAEIEVASYSIPREPDRGILKAAGRFETTLDLSFLRGLKLTAVGRLDRQSGRMTVALTQCADIAFRAYLRDATVSIRDGTGRICAPARGPFIAADEAGWRLDAAWSEASGMLPEASAAISHAGGLITLSGTAGGAPGGRLKVDRAVLSDLETEKRFAPVAIAGDLALANQEWRGTLELSNERGRLATVALRHAVDKSAGEARVLSSELVFEPGRFQPADLSPLLTPLGPEVRGRAAFAGRVAWNPAEMESRGEIRLLDMSFRTPLGRATGVRGTLALTSLTPPAFAPSQTVTAERIAWLIPIEQVSARFSLEPEAIRLETATGAMAGGRVSLDPQVLSFAPASTTTGTLRFSGIDPAPFISVAGLAGRVMLETRITGLVPFTLGPEGLRFQDGRIAAEQPGRLSIRRDALTAAVGTGAGGQTPPGAVQDFAYQALEYLAFDSLEGTVNSLPQGRLGLLLRVKGKHDPPEAKEPRVGVFDLLRGRAFDRPLPLPKGTPVDLTLDTSINLDELVASYFGSMPAASESRTEAR